MQQYLRTIEEARKGKLEGNGPHYIKNIECRCTFVKRDLETLESLYRRIRRICAPPVGVEVKPDSPRKGKTMPRKETYRLSISMEEEDEELKTLPSRWARLSRLSVPKRARVVQPPSHRYLDRHTFKLEPAPENEEED